MCYVSSLPTNIRLGKVDKSAYLIINLIIYRDYIYSCIYNIIKIPLVDIYITVQKHTYIYILELKSYFFNLY